MTSSSTGCHRGEKARLRRELRRRLRSLPAGTKRRRAEELTARVLDLPEVQGASNVFLCLSFGVEIDTWGLAERLRQEGKTTFVPRVVLDDHSFHVHPFPCRLESLPMGLRQPASGEAELAEDAIDPTLDVALILGLAFDRRGVRLGHGGGFFDRFLARHPLRTVGLAYDEQLVERLPREAHDVPMHRVATPSGLVTPG